MHCPPCAESANTKRIGPSCSHSHKVVTRCSQETTLKSGPGCFPLPDFLSRLFPVSIDRFEFGTRVKDGYIIYVVMQPKEIMCCAKAGGRVVYV